MICVDIRYQKILSESFRGKMNRKKISRNTQRLRDPPPSLFSNVSGKREGLAGAQWVDLSLCSWREI